MKKRLAKLTSCLLCLAMLLSIAAPAVAATADGDAPLFAPDLDISDEALSIDAPDDGGEASSAAEALPAEDPAAALSAAGEYEIYPTPHSITYGAASATVTLPATMQVTYGAGIDEYTKARAVEAFKQVGVTLSESAATSVKLQVSIDASVANSDKSGAHTVTIDANGITVVGKDTDAAFYGLTTVKHILYQVAQENSKTVRQLTVEDYADVAFRGFIEGYYGNPWSVEDRAELMKFGGELKMNIYFYAPKDDPKHSSQWRELYSDEEIETKIKPLAQAGNESKCYYGFALHPFWANAINFSDDAAYAADLEVLKAKFEQVIAAGVRQIAVLADDRDEPGVGAAKSYVRLMKDLTDWVASDEMQQKYPGLKKSIPFCPNDYMHNGDSNQMQALKALPATVPVIQTGGQIWGEVSNDFLNTYYGHMGNGPFLWVNWPCSDNSKGSLTMGAQDVILHRNLDKTKIEGIMLNPMQQSEPSKQAIFSNADYAWNIWTGSDNTHSDQVWKDSFKYVDHMGADDTDTSIALRELSKHMIHQNKNVNNNYPESVELAPTLTSFQEKLTANTLTKADVTALKAEFQKLKDAATLYKNKTTGNTRILGKRNADGSYPQAQEQMAPWLDCWEEFAQANLDLLDALALSLDNADGSNNNAIVQSYLAGQNALSASQNHSFWYVDHNETAIVGGQRLVPFTDNLLNAVSTIAKTILDPSVLVETIITNRTDTPAGGLEAMRDGNVNTAAIFKTPDDIAANEYVGLQYNRLFTLNQVRFELGESSNANNTFNGCKLQYLNADNVWTDIQGAIASHDHSGNTNATTAISATGLHLQAKGVRVIATQAKNTIWLGIKEIYINDEGTAPENPVETYTGVTASLSSDWVIPKNGGVIGSITDGNASTITMLRNANGADNCPAGAYIELDLGSEKGIGTVSLVGDKSATGDRMANAKIQYKSGDNWVDAATDITTGDFSINLSSQNITTQYLRVVNTTQVAVWVRIGEISVTEPHVENRIDEIAYQSDTVKRITDPVGALTDNSASLSASGVILKPGEFVGISLPTPRRVVDIVADYTPAPGVVLKVGMNEQELRVITPSQPAAASLLAVERALDDEVIKLVRLENEGQQTASFVLNELSILSDNVTGIHFDSSTMANRDTDQDARSLNNAGNWFDGEITTSAKFCDTQDDGEDVIYDLGQVRSISNIKAYVRDSETDYVRRGKIQISMDKETWTDVVDLTGTGAIGVGATTAQSAGWAGSSTYPNYVYKEGSLATPKDARYLRVVFTGNFNAKWLVFNEIVINGGEYVSVESNPAFTASPQEGSAKFIPSHLTDGDLTTAFKPGAAGKGSISYRLSDFTAVGQLNILGDSAAQDATVSVRTDATTWKTLNTKLGDGLTELAIPEEIANVLEVKIAWTSGAPTLYELIPVERVQSGGQASSDVETVAINSYSGSDCTILFDENWKFNLGDASGASALVYNDSAWRTVDLPHDYSIEGEFSSANEAESGYLRGGVGWYRKSFTVSPDWENKVVTIDFGGIYMDSVIYLNGTKLGEHHYGYTPFSFVLPSDVLKYDAENVIAVKTDDSFPSSRWYSGAGIYRSVHLTVSDPVHVARYGTKVETPADSNGQPSGTVNIKTTVENSGAQAASVTVKQEIFELDAATYKPKGAAVATDTTSSAASVTAGGTHDFTQNFSVSNPKIWNSWDKGEPNLYLLKTTVLVDGVEKDTYTTEFGFRCIDWDVNNGFKLNGQWVKLKGVCQHHDQGALGAEAWYRALERQVEILMDMGCNSIRVTHNPAADELIEICGRKGVLIIDEAFDGLSGYKNGNSHDFTTHFNEALGAGNNLVGKKSDSETWAQFALETMINRDKNSPAVIMYSMGNEVQQDANGDTSNFPTIIQNLVTWGKAIDATRFFTMGDNTRSTGYDDNNKNKSVGDLAYEMNLKIVETAPAGMGIVGFNYASEGQVTNGHNKGWKMYGSETASAVNSRGVYDDKTTQAAQTSTQRLTSYDINAVSWGATASDAWWRAIRYDYNGGEFVWTGFDYIGEPTPWNGMGSGWKAGENSPKSSFFGIIDTNGIPKDSYYLYRSMWNEKETGGTTLHLLPTWDRDDLLITNNQVEVVVYTNAPQIKLFLNGAQVGAAKTNETTTGAGHKYRTFASDAMTGSNTFVTKTGHQSLYATFNVPYAAGTLEVKAYDASGNEITDTVGRSVVNTTNGTGDKLRVTADRQTIKNDGRDLSYITIDVVDVLADGTEEIVNGAEPTITVSVSGDGRFMGMDNGVQPDHTPYWRSSRSAGAGRLVAIVQSTKDEGEFTLTATADGLTTGAVTVKTSGAEQSSSGDAPVSYDIAKTIYVQLNTEPTLPETAVVTLGNGTKETKNVTWNDYNKSLLSTVGSEFAITGVIHSSNYTVPVSVGVVVLDDIAAILNYSDAVQVGVEPKLPASRPAVMADGSVVSAQFAVKWETLPASSYSKEGTVTVHGTAEAFGKTYPVTATVRVTAGTLITGEEQANRTDDEHNGFGIDNEAFAANLANIRDGSSTTTWTGSGGVHFGYATAIRVHQVHITYSGTVPTSGVHIMGSPTAYDSGFEEIPVTTQTSGQTVTYTVNNLRGGDVGIQLKFDNSVTVAEVEIIPAIVTYPINSTADLTDIKLSGESAPAAQLAAKTVKTTAVMAAVVPVTDANVAYTVLPEDADGRVLIVTESEDHATRALYTVILGAPAEITDAADDTMDYDRTKTTATAPSAQNGNPDGPVSWAVDGNETTYWHSAWDNTGTGPTDLSKDSENRYIQLTLQEATELVALRYLPRGNGTNDNGVVTGYQIWVSANDTVTPGSKDGFTKVSEGTWPRSANWQIAKFDQVTAKHVRLYATATYAASGNDKFMSAREIRVVKAPSGDTDLSLATVSVNPLEYDWTGSPIRPGTDAGSSVTVSLMGTQLSSDKYTLSYDNNTDPGAAYVYAKAKAGSGYTGTAYGVFTIVKENAKITSFEPVTVATQAGLDPTSKLPATVKACLNNDGRLEVDVTWPAVTAAQYQTPGTYTIKGEVDEETAQLLASPDLRPTLTLTVSAPTSVNEVTAVTQTGVIPTTLPATVTVQFDDGTSRACPVTWNLAGKDFSQEGIVEVTGTIEGIPGLTATARVRVSTDGKAKSNFTIQSITLDGDNVLSDFNADKLLTLELAKGEAIPVLAVTVDPDDNASVSIVQATRVPGAAQAGGAWATATVTSEDGSKVETYTVKFLREGMTGDYYIDLQLTPAAQAHVTIEPISADAGETVTVTVDPGYELTDSWIKVIDGSSAGTNITLTNGTFLMPAGNVQFTADVAPIEYTITYLLNDGTDPGNPTAYNITTRAFTLKAPTKAGHTFMGWIGGGLTEVTRTVIINPVGKGDIGNRTYTAVWQTNSGGPGGGGSSGGGSSSGGSSSGGDSQPTQPENAVVTTKDPATGGTTVTTTTPTGLVSAVTTTPEGKQTATIQIPQNSSSVVEAAMPALDTTGGKIPELAIQNNTTRPVSVTVPFTGSDTIVAVRVEKNGSETVIPLSVVDEDGLRIKTQPGNQTIRLVDNKKTFIDVPAAHWAAKAVDFASSRELFNGMGRVDTFAPAAAMDRAMMTTVLWRLSEKPTASVTGLFNDVVSGAYYEQAVAWGVATGVVKGTGRGFEPNAPVTRETLAVMLYRAAGSPTVVDEMPRRFTDGAQVSSWAQEAMIWCIQNNIINGRTDTTLASKDVASRAEVAAMLQRFVDQQV